jgi:hypothetical protein
MPLVSMRSRRAILVVLIEPELPTSYITPRGGDRKCWPETIWREQSGSRSFADVVQRIRHTARPSTPTGSPPSAGVGLRLPIKRTSSIMSFRIRRNAK